MKLTKFAEGAGGVSFINPNILSIGKNEGLWVSESSAFRQVSGKVF